MKDDTRTLHQKLSVYLIQPHLLFPGEHGAKFLRKFVVLMICTVMAFMGRSAFGYDDSGTESDLYPSDKANFTLVEYSYEVDCRSGVIIIRWVSDTEVNVANYRIHRRKIQQASESMPVYVESHWVGASHIVAKGNQSNYNIVDAQIDIGTSYNYRLYGYDESLMLSQAKIFSLNQATIPSCFYLPIVYQ